MIVVPTAVAFLAVGALVFFFLLPRMFVPEAVGLREYAHSLPPVAVVFTSRTNASSFEAAAPEGEGYSFPGLIPWAADEGRLRLLSDQGRVYELTWGRTLPDGGTLIDVMSPTVSLDGKRVLFAGRRAPPDVGRWRIYEVGVDGRDLRQLTGLPHDTGCIAVPPMRYAADGGTLGDDERRRLDYDDIDPIDIGLGRLVFASSRLPDLGRDHSRRATQVWILASPDSAPRPLSANRNNDRWPWLVPAEQMIVFSLWSRNREVVGDDGEIRPVAEGMPVGVRAVTRPTDFWMAARIQPGGEQFGYAAKLRVPVWRPRSLHNGRLVFMTPDGERLRVGQSEWGALQVAPSSLAVGTELPRQLGGETQFGPDRTADGRPLTVGTPSPCPSGSILVAAAPTGSPAADFGLYQMSQDWSQPVPPVLLFDDPRLADAEPVAVLPRPILVSAADPINSPSTSGPLALLEGRSHTGPTGRLQNPNINTTIVESFPGSSTDYQQQSVVRHPVGVSGLAVFAAHRDRFDDPIRPRVSGGWEKLLLAQVNEQGVETRLPAEPLMPTVIAGVDQQGKVVRWTGGRDSVGRAATFYAVAGDHYSGTRVNGYHFCVGCHTGHTFIPADIAER